MGCGSSSADASAPGRWNDDPDMEADGGRIKYDKKTGKGVMADAGKDDDGREDDFFEVEEATGEQFMAVRPWIGQVAEPESHNDIVKDQPDTTYELEYVYGYRCADSKQNVHFNSAGEAVYMTAALGVILNRGTNTQKFFGGGEVANTAKNVANDQNHHTDDIMCLKVCPARATAASGQVGSKPTIFTWDACTGQKKERMKLAKGSRGINCVAINAEGWIAAADLHNDHHVLVFDASGNQVFKQKGDQNKIHDIAWDAKPGSTRFMTGGVKHVYFWDRSDGTGGKTRGLWDGNEQTSFACVTWDNNGKAYGGGSNGRIYTYGGSDGRTCEGTMKHHVGFVCALKFHNGNLYSGAKDGKLCQINIGNSQVTKTIEYPSLVRAIDCDDSGNLLCGQRDGTISYEDGSRTNIMYSHSDGEVWGLAQQADGTVVTSADDNKVMFWNPDSRSFIKQAKVSDRKKKAKRGGASTLSKYPDSQCSRCVAVNDQWLVVAGNDGAVSIRAQSAPDVEVKLIQDSTEWIEVMAFSPNNKYLAVGSHDNNVYVYDAEGDFANVGKCSAHNSYIMAMDWSAGSDMIRSNCGAYELLFHAVPSCAQDPSGRSNTTGTTWASKTCKFQWETEGIYPSGTDGTHINGVAGSTDGMLLATGDDYGLVCLFRDPCRSGGKPRSYRGHSEHVVRVAFNSNDSRLFSIGGYDQTLMQWKKC